MALVKPRDVVTEVPKESAALKDQSSEEQLKESNKDTNKEGSTPTINRHESNVYSCLTDIRASSIFMCFRWLY